jgi:hypothetical protein
MIAAMSCLQVTSVRNAVVTTLVLMTCGSAHGQERVSAEGFLGGAFSFGTTLSVSQEGFPDIEHSASYETRAFEFPLYYALRIGLHDGTGAWEVQFVHHKVYLNNNPPEIQSFEITHGYNLLTFGRAWTDLPVTLRIGGGVVIAHPENEVRGMPFSPGYQLTGPAFIGGVGKRLPLGNVLFASLETQLSFARAKVPVSGGGASVPNVTLHLLVGLGARF